MIPENGAIVEQRRTDTGDEPMAEARKLLPGLSFDRILATGYGRGQLEEDGDAPSMTEISAHAAGARFFFPEACNVGDPGGQDSKAIAMNAAGKVIRFGR